MTHLSLGDASLITVTFLFTDIEGSTGLWERQPDAMRSALQRHNVLLAQAISRHHGYVFKTVGDAFCVTFDDPGHAVAAAFDIQRGLANERWPLSTPLRVRVALHTGAAYLCEGDYFGTTVNRCARLLAVTRGGQTLLTSATQTLLRDPLPSGCQLRDTGMLRLRDLPHPIHVFQLIHPGLSAELQQITEDVTKPTSQPLARLRPIDVYEVPTLPAVVMHALHVLQDPDSDAKAVQQVISNDPAISAKILRVANSAFFGRSRRVGTIAEAINVLGFINVQGILISVSAFDAFRTKRLNLLDFWKHSIATATAARFLSRHVPLPADQAFMAGLLHDIGKLIFAVQAEGAYQRMLELRQQTPMSSLQAEQTLFEFTHPEVGAMVAERWDLPPPYIAAVAHHHHPDDAGEHQAFAALIGLANEMAHHVQDEVKPGDEPIPEPDDQCAALLARLSLEPKRWDDGLEHLRAEEKNFATFIGAIH
ncbi:MAG TPA: HDOD domain-containing protein [Accumulibacter sp.]|uniref:HDOD domain-containing protein n=1 Tax=Accumulibacter sp. TaxID=2053492 RepID=UPI0028790780|nr:HDOD domain-containing protein [Accumulibacter sp.]MDS4075075.1 HDOD domain-containing protein [Accumulibacter sp.]HMW19279.1 HDOD domain-containing protein [Accumulibacter sp.]HMX23920.1 HDOD domain-containing protein [Accumulibacter sp.]HND81564.1 HDOD domain-containing protein [Accumulibacter sp.]HNL15140.1 HDOD domain-containing protein [Accumulibacter sp.]